MLWRGLRRPRRAALSAAGGTTRIVFRPEESTRCRRFEFAPGPVRASFAAAGSLLVARRRRRSGRDAAPADAPTQGRELEPRRAALLPAAARRDRAAQRRGRHRLSADARRRAALEGRAAVQARHRDRPAGARRRPGARGRRRVAPGAARLARTRCATRSSCWSRSTALPEAEEPLDELLRQCAATGAAGDARGACRASSAARRDRHATARARRARAAALRRRARHARLGAGRHRPRLAGRRRSRQGAGGARTRASDADPARRRRRPCSRSTCCRRRPRPRRSSRAIWRPSRRAAAVRLLYVRTLADVAAPGRGDRRRSQVLTQADPTLAPPWLTLGALELELQHPQGGQRGAAELRAPGRGRGAGELPAARRRPRRRQRRRRRRGRHAAEHERAR